MQLWAAYLLSMLHTLQETNHKLDMNQWLYFLGRVAVYLFSSQLIIHFVRECTCNPSITVSAYPYHLQRGLAAARLLGLRVQIPPGAWTSVSLECCMLYRQRSLRRADPSSRGVLPSVYASHWMWSGETITFYSYNERLGRQRSDCMYVHTHTHTHTHTHIHIHTTNTYKHVWCITSTSFQDHIQVISWELYLCEKQPACTAAENVAMLFEVSVFRKQDSFYIWHNKSTYLIWIP